MSLTRNMALALFAGAAGWCVAILLHQNWYEMFTVILAVNILGGVTRKDAVRSPGSETCNTPSQRFEYVKRGDRIASYSLTVSVVIAYILHHYYSEWKLLDSTRTIFAVTVLVVCGLMYEVLPADTPDNHVEICDDFFGIDG